MIILLGNGIIGSSIKDVFQARYEKPTSFITQQFTRKDFDLSTVSLKELKNEFLPCGASYLINCMGYTNVDLAEKERDLAYDVNASGAYKLAVFCKQNDITMVQISSDFIFDGRSPYKYTEYDEPNPINYYGYTKLMGEKMVMNSGCDYIIVRTSWLYNDEKGIVPYLVEQLKKGKPRKIYGVKDQTIAPTYAKDLAKQILIMLENNLSGLFHATNSGDIHPDVLMKYLAEKLQIEIDVEETTRFTFYNGRAKRPYLSLLSNSNLEALGLHVMPTWKDSVDKFIKRTMQT